MNEEQKDILNVFESLCSEGQKLLEAEKLSFWLKKEEKVILVAAVGYPRNTLNLLNYNIGEGVTGYIAEGHEVIGNWSDLQSKPYWKGKWDALIWRSEHPYESFSFIGVPIFLNSKPIGLLKAERINSKLGDFGNSDLKILKTLALAASTAIGTDSTILKNQEMPYIFVLMPFSSDFTDIYKFGIKEVASQLNMRCERIDEIEFNNQVLLQIYAGIERADIIVADMTGKNPNVFYEVGYAHAKEKEVVLLTQKAEDIPFDLKGHNHIVYANSIDKLRNHLKTRLKAIVSSKRGH